MEAVRQEVVPSAAEADQDQIYCTDLALLIHATE